MPNKTMPSAVRRADLAFTARHGRPATADELGVDAEDLASWRASDGVAAAQSKAIRTVIGDMTAQEQRVLLSRIVEGRDLDAIAHDEGLAPATATRLYARAIESLRSAIPEAAP